MMLSRYKESGRLCGMELVEQAVCLDNRRALSCFLTAKGQARVKQINEMLNSSQ